MPSGCRVNSAIDILVTFPQLLWLHYSVISPKVPRRSCEMMAQYEAQYWEPLLNCCTYSTVYCSAEKNLIEYLQKFFTDPVKGWPCTFLTALFENLTGPDFQLRTTFRCGRDRDHLRVTSTWQFIPMIRPMTFLCRSKFVVSLGLVVLPLRVVLC